MWLSTKNFISKIALPLSSDLAEKLPQIQQVSLHKYEKKSLRLSSNVVLG